MQLQAERVRHDAEKAHYEAELEMYQQAEVSAWVDFKFILSVVCQLKRQQLQQSTDDRTDQLIANEEIEMENAVMKDALTKLRRVK